jgi:hypothetical protein
MNGRLLQQRRKYRNRVFRLLITRSIKESYKIKEIVLLWGIMALLFTSCGPKYQCYKRIRASRCRYCGKILAADTTEMYKKSCWINKEGDRKIVRCRLRKYGDVRYFPFFTVVNDTVYAFDYRSDVCDSCKLSIMKSNFNQLFARGIEEYNKGNYYSAMEDFEGAMKEACSNDMYSICIGCGWGYYRISEKAKYDSTEQCGMCKKALEWANEAFEKKSQAREQRENEIEQQLMERRKDYGEYFRSIIVHFSKDVFSEECLIPHCEDYEVWTSGPEYRRINVSSPYMDKKRADFLLNILITIGNFTQDNLDVMERYYGFTHIYWINSKTGKSWVYGSR